MKEELFAMDCGCVHKTIVDENGKRLFLFDMNEEPDFPDCPKTWELLGDGRTVAVFQLESNLGQTWSRKLKPKNLEHMSALGAVLRPGCLQSVTEDGVSMTSHYCKRVNKEEDADPLHSSLNEMLSDTENVMIYQEQMMKIGAKLAGLDKKEVDKLRKAVGKKNQKDLNEIGKVFIEKAEKIGIVTKEQAETIFENIKASGRYLFNKCLCPNTIVHIYNDKSPDITGKQAVILDDVKIGDLIYTKHGFSRVLDKIESGKKRLYKIITESGYTLKCTLDHKIDCYDGIQRPLHEIIENNHLIFADFGIGERIISCQSVGLERTIDIEVKNPSHTFYANGISVSNSHSYSYGSTGYDTAYLKSHFPVQYFTSCLSMAKDAEEKSILIQDSKSFGITVNPPCIRNSRGNFYTDGEQIWFGINNIKKIGRKNSSKLKNILLENNKDYKTINWVEWLLTCGQECNSTMKILVMAGAFDCMNIKRQLMLEHLKIVKELSDGEIKWVKNNIKDNFLDCLKNMAKTKKEGGGCHNNKRVEIVKSMISLVENCPYSLEDNVAWIVWAEEQTLGLPVSKNKVESYDLSDINCYAKEYNDGMCGRLTIGVELVQVKEITTKKGKNVGSKMAFIVGSDKTGIIENIVCFPDKWKDFSEFLVEGNTVLISGERKSKDDGFVVGMVSQLV